MKEAWVSQYDSSKVPGAGDTACFRASRIICVNLGADPKTVPEGTVRRFQCAKEPGVPDPDETHAATEYLKLACGMGRGVIAGIDYKPGISQNRDKITDHFLVLARISDDGNVLRGLNPGAVVPPDMDYNVEFTWMPTRGAWVRTWPDHLENTVISMVVPDVARGASLKERP